MSRKRKQALPGGRKIGPYGKLHVLNLRLSKDLLAAIDQRARTHQLSRTFIVERLLRQCMGLPVVTLQVLPIGTPLEASDE